MSFSILKTINSPGVFYYHLKCGHCSTECGIFPEEIVRREYKFQSTNDTVVEFIWNCAKCNNENADLEKNLPSPIFLKVGVNVVGESLK
jgi:hypothetical protein